MGRMTDHEPVRLRRVGAAGHRLAARLWDRDDGIRLASAALVPAELAFRGASAFRSALYDAGVLRSVRVGARVISIGNLTVGGAGKTPFTRWVIDRLLARGRRPAILHRGTGDDEPALHRAWHPDVPVLVGADRVASARLAIARGADVVVLDDGFQHRRLARDLDIVLIAAEHAAAPVRLLPRGPWREGLAALRRAHIVVVTRRTASAQAAAALARRLPPGLDGAPVVRVVLESAGWRRDGRAAAPPADEAFAITSIATPAAFAANARAAGADVRDGLAFPDHHAFSMRDVARIVDEAAGRPLVMTEKDAVKLVPLLPDTPLWVLLQRARIEDGAAAVEAALAQRS
jgi:tetraacyldisaccharide 4'-kinase